MVFASAVFVPVQTMPEWLQVFANHQPVTHVVNAVRYLTTGGASADAAFNTLMWIAGIILLFSPIATRLFCRAV